MMPDKLDDKNVAMFGEELRNIVTKLPNETDLTLGILIENLYRIIQREAERDARELVNKGQA